LALQSDVVYIIYDAVILCGIADTFQVPDNATDQVRAAHVEHTLVPPITLSFNIGFNTTTRPQVGGIYSRKILFSSGAKRPQNSSKNCFEGVEIAGAPDEQNFSKQF